MGILNNLSNQNNPMQMLQELKSNPAEFLKRAGVSVPQGMTDPQSILQHLIQTNQVTQQQVNRAYQAAQRFR